MQLGQGGDGGVTTCVPFPAGGRRFSLSCSVQTCPRDDPTSYPMSTWKSSSGGQAVRTDSVFPFNFRL